MKGRILEIIIKPEMKMMRCVRHIRQNNLLRQSQNWYTHFVIKNLRIGEVYFIRRKLSWHFGISPLNNNCVAFLGGYVLVCLIVWVEMEWIWWS